VTGKGVTEQWSYADSDPDFFLQTITGLVAHYSQLVQRCMAAASEGLRGSSCVRKTAHNYGVRRRCNYGLRR